MGDHYYTEKPNVESKRERITETIAGETLQFYVDRGVFSKAGLDFGTRLLLESFEPPTLTGSYLDVGCGWGPIGITLAKLNPGLEIYMVDINKRAVELSIENGKMNGVKNINVFQNNLLSGFTEKFAVVLTNPPIRAGKEIVFRLYEQAAASLLTNGELWVVIQKKQGAPSTITKLVELNLEVDVVKKSKGYFIIRGKNR
ncbi:class I SAM-dependent methyltransferase [Evansella tamaricis]|uniref:Class I SAM-dependent methyltransferase n=1 Tax=Evansella tamaricis TaxID=2069301 RepID=A0ABS6JAV9_9BACI|nr:class I SAM-dependent methyltransferase [Evansella tamaricis]MBU9710818.1 class I SAM-dependent methyltransferase [Evansella tamaricis]